MRQAGDQTASVLLRESSQKSVTCCRGLFRSSRNLFSTCNTSHLPRELVRIAAKTCIILIVIVEKFALNVINRIAEQHFLTIKLWGEAWYTSR